MPDFSYIVAARLLGRGASRWEVRALAFELRAAGVSDVG